MTYAIFVKSFRVVKIFLVKVTEIFDFVKSFNKVSD